MSEADLDQRAVLPALRARPGHLFWRASARVQAALAEVLPPGVDVHAYAVLLCLADGAVRSQQEIADMVVVSRTTMTRVIGELTSSGLVDRVRNPRDRRSYALSRTPAGATAARGWRRHVTAVQQRVTAGLSTEEHVDLVGLLQRVAEDDLHPDLPEELRAATGFLISSIHARLHRVFAAELEPTGLEPREFGSLTAMRASGPMTQSELARVLGVSGPTVVEIVDRLEQLDCLERRRDPVDRRSQRLHLLPGAETVYASSRAAVDRLEDALLGGLGDAGRQRLSAYLLRIITGEQILG